MCLMSNTAVSLGRMIQAGETTAQEVTQAALSAIEKKDGALNSFVTVDGDGALRRAEKVQRQIEAGELKSPLAGVPVALKDNLCTEGLLTTCSSKILYNYVPVYTATAVKRLEEAGAIVLGKTNMDEFAMGSTTETSAFGATKNPWNPAHVPGAPPAARARRWRRRRRRLRSGRTPEARSASPVRFAG